MTAKRALHMKREVSMSDSSTPLSQLRELVAAFVHERDWERFHTPKDLAAAISIEAAELLEVFLWQPESDVQVLLETTESKEKIAAELADVLIYCICLANQLDLDMTSVILNKLAVNRAKYPTERARGTSKKYTEL